MLCIAIPWAMSRRTLLAMLLVYMDCWKSIDVGDCGAFWALTCLHVRCQQMRIIYHEFRYCRRGARSDHFTLYPRLFFSVALQCLGPIDQNYIYYLWMLPICEFRLGGIVFNYVARFADLRCTMHRFFTCAFRNCFPKRQSVFKARSNWHVKLRVYTRKYNFGHRSRLHQWHARTSNIKI